jgi:hypothetical protein
MRLRALVTHMRRSAGIGCCAAILISGCGQGTTIIRKTSAPPPPAPIDVNALIISVDEVQRVAGVDGLAASPSKREPSHFPRRGVPEPCQPPYQDDVSFGTGWTQFRSEAYATSTNPGSGQARGMADILQAAAVYKDADSARAEFDRVAASLTACAALHDARHGFAVDKTDTSTLAGGTRTVAFSYRVKSTALVKVVAIGVPDLAEVTSKVLQRITDRIN